MKLFSVIRKDLLILVRNRMAMAVLFVLPLTLIVTISLALGAGDGYRFNRDNQMISLPVVNYDGGPYAQALLAVVGESLKLETSFEAGQLQALGLSEAGECGPVFGIVPVNQATQAVTSPEAKVTETAAAEMDGGSARETQTVTAEMVGPDALETQTASPGPGGQSPESGGAGDTSNQTTAPQITEVPATAEATGETEVAGAEPTPMNTAEAVASSSPACNEKAARALLRKSARPAVLIIPFGFSETVAKGEQARVELIYDPTGDEVLLQQVEGVLKGAAMRISLENQVSHSLDQLNDLIFLAPVSVRESWQAQRIQTSAEDRAPALSLIKVLPITYRPIDTPNTYQQTVPGFAVMFAFFVIIAMAGSIREERLHGTFRRLLIAPVSQTELAVGKLFSAMLVVFLQVIFLFTSGAILFQLGLGNDPVAFLVLTGALTITAAALGLAISTTSLKGPGLAVSLVIAALLGGCIFPIDLMPPFLRGLSRYVPHTWALTGYQDLLVRGLGLQEIVPEIGVLLGFSLLFLLIAIWRFRFED